jgi:hypothetical protein
MFLTETASIVDDNLELNNYNILQRTDNERIRRDDFGNITYLKNKYDEKDIKVLKYIVNYETVYNKQEFISIVLTKFCNLNLFFLSIYKSIDCSITLLKNSINDIIIFIKNDLLISSPELIIFGDFNLDIHEKQNLDIIPKFFVELNLDIENKLDECLISTNFQTQTDLCFSNVKGYDLKVGYFESLYSEHKPIWLTLDLFKDNNNNIESNMNIISDYIDQEEIISSQLSTIEI